MFVDYAGKKPSILDPQTGEVIEVELFVAVLGASNYTYVEATRTQRVVDFVSSVSRAFSFFGGVTRAVVPDQLKSAVTTACRYDPAIQRTMAELGRHYATTILPARPKSPRDKAKVEVGVQIVERWVLAKIRNERFESIGALNARLFELTADLNGRMMRTYNASRRELYARLDKPALSPLPEQSFEAAAWKKVSLNIDYHIEFDHHLYSAPHTLLRQELWVRASTRTIEILHADTRVASRRTYAVTCMETPRHSPSTCRARTALKRNGPPRASCHGPTVSGQTRARSAKSSCASDIIPSGVFARASDCFVSPRSTTLRVSTAPALVLCTPERAATAPSRPSSSTTSTASPFPTPKSLRLRAPCTRTCAVATITTELYNKENSQC